MAKSCVSACLLSSCRSSLSHLRSNAMPKVTKKAPKATDPLSSGTAKSNISSSSKSKSSTTSTAHMVPAVHAANQEPSNSTKRTLSLKQRLQKLLENQLQRVIILLGKLKKSSGSWPSPRVIDKFLSADEATQLIERYTPLWQHKSGVVNSKGKLNRASEYRSCFTVRVPPLGDPLMLQVERRAADAAQTLPYAYCEDFQLACWRTLRFALR
jgi:hypothetical protein